ncbi:MAG: branched-chain amino acid ABC transporter permease [Spirochaetes bacterium]|nr:MAG: branched-chain amino acid ABC transporter permease [Spirochaetota bacterium]
MDFILHILIMISIYSIFAMSLNLELGYTGLYNFGHIAFFGIGAYSSAILSKAGFGFFPPLIIGMGLSIIASFIIGIPALRLRGDYFGIATLGFGEIMRLFFLNEAWLTRGPMGIPGILPPSFFGIIINTLPRFLILNLIFMILIWLFLYILIKSPFGRVLKAIREDEAAALSLGKNVYLFRLKSLMIGSAIAAIAGSLWAHYISYISPNEFTLTETIIVLLMVVLGGEGTLSGPIIGALTIIGFQEILRFFNLPPSLSRYIYPLREMVFGLTLVLLMIYKPQGIVGRRKDA